MVVGIANPALFMRFITSPKVFFNHNWKREALSLSLKLSQHVQALRSIIQNRPVLSLNVVVFALTMILGRFTYNGTIVAQGDALYILCPQYAESFFQLLYNQYTEWEGRLANSIIWAVLQRLSHYSNAQTPLEYPCWFPIALAQFSLLAASINISFFFSRLFRTSTFSSLLIFLIFISAWTTSPTLFSYTLNPGNGLYPIFTYVFSCLLLAFSGTYSKSRLVCGYFLYVFVLFGADTLWVGAILSALYLRLIDYKYSPCKTRPIIRVLPVMVLPMISSLIVYYSPGFQRRVGVFTRTGTVFQFEANVDFLQSLITHYFHRLVVNTYLELQDSLLIPNTPISWEAFHLFCIVVFCYISGSRFKRYLKYYRSGERPFWKLPTQHAVWFTVIFMVGVHASFIRQFVSSYHGQYANDGPTFLLVLYLTCLATVLLQTRPIFKRFSTKLSFAGLIVISLLIPNISWCLNKIEWAESYTTSLISAYQEIILRLENKTENVTFSILGAPRESLYIDVEQMLIWADIRSVSLMQVGTTSYKPEKANSEINVNSPLVLPPYHPLKEFQLPQLVREQMYHGEYIRDYWIPNFENYQIQVDLNPNMGGSSYYVSKFHYEFMSGVVWNFSRKQPERNMSLNLVSQVSSNDKLDPLQISWVYENIETGLLPLDAIPILRLKVVGGNPLYTAASSRIHFSVRR